MTGVPNFVKDPDYRLRWPNHIFAAELQRLIGRAKATGLTLEWREEVELLLKQAFASAVPTEEFHRLAEYEKRFGEEPF